MPAASTANRINARRQYGSSVVPKRSYSRVAGLSVLGVLVVIVVGGWLLATPSDDYVLLPDDPHPADAVVSVGGKKPTISKDGSGIYYLDVLVHRASLPESWIARFEDGADIVPASAIVPPGGSQSDLDRLDHLTFQDSRTVAGVVALRALGRKVTVQPTGVTFDGVEQSAPAVARRAPARHDHHRDRRCPGAAVERAPHPAAGPQAGIARPPQVRDGKKTLELRTTLTSDPQDSKRAIVGVLGVHDAPPKADLPVTCHDHPARPRPRPLGGPRVHARGLRRAQRPPPRERPQDRRDRHDGSRRERRSDRRRAAEGAGRRAPPSDVVLVPDANAADARKAAHGRVKVIAVTSFREALKALGASPAAAPEA